ncbi:hypothetical protein NEOLI_000183 [Neolecta irregularis DAH-3]|uniref:Uncharacterized protein n=1 Tax=Neolecta irregularis (strain DAH-3) TaxID=1198029 RepID=A0A1U7LTL6_NEOID|nr:hypothetical protein NEOLI_000183 [Neolecta irregularis DAH-3]|eukprot:OLL26010.1 hypothetical protein NEOLI_000183 [Neolecta irregularis DAH-3]
MSNILVFSGGSAANSIVSAFGSNVSYVIPVSDNGGSTSEIMRVIGGMGIGDIRSRLVRLIPDEKGEKSALKDLLGHRLTSEDKVHARNEWLNLIEGLHPVWNGVSSEKRQVIRSFLTHTQAEISKRSRPSLPFDFRNGSIGNFFLSGARLFFGSLESAIFQFASIAGIPEKTAVLPILNSNFSQHIAAKLTNGEIIAGQSQISHQIAESSDASSGEDDTFLPGSLPSLRTPSIMFNKQEEEPLNAPVEKIYYINVYGHEVQPVANPKVVKAIHRAHAIIYSIGSLYTSIIPSLILSGIGDAIATSTSVRCKILLLNSTLDRETGPGSKFTAFDFVKAIHKACLQSINVESSVNLGYRQFITHIIYLRKSTPPLVNVLLLKEYGIQCVGVTDSSGRFDPVQLHKVLEMIMGRCVRTRSMTMNSAD